MKKIFALALKDLRLMPRNRGGMFFTFVWPVLVTVLFGIMFGGNDDGTQGKVKIAIVDDDNTDGSRAFAKGLEESFELKAMNRVDAENAVRLGRQAGYIVMTPGFGDASDHIFYGESKQVEVGVDPARKAEAGMIEGLLMKQAAAGMQQMFNDPNASSRMVDKALGDMKGAPPDQVAPVQRFLGELKAFTSSPQAQGPPGSPQGEWQPLKITKKDVARVSDGPRNPFDITFPQGVIWGLIGCAMSFGISLVTERTHGTLVRLRMAPLTNVQILGGKALSCFSAILVVEWMLLGVAYGFGVRPTSYGILALAGFSAAICFVGFMMLVASLGKTEQTASGAGWAMLMPLSMIGGAMVPTFVMPAWVQSISFISPIRWTMLAIEGGVWRNFSLTEMATPCAILIGVGLACFAIGTRGLKEA
jgi:ABC-2 type transport system permease protein